MSGRKVLKAASRKKRNAYLFILPLLFLVLFVIFGPLVFLYWTSFMYWPYNKPWITPTLVGVDNYIQILSNPVWGYLHSLQVSLLFIVFAVPIEFVLGLLLALLFIRPFRGKGLVMTIMIVPMVIMPIVAGFMFLLLYYPVRGWLMYYASLIIHQFAEVQLLADPDLALFSIAMADVWEWTPFIFLVILAGLSALPPEPFEAARVDGASYWTTFRRITFPMLRFPIMVGLLIRIADSFKLFDLVWVMTQGGPGVVTQDITVWIYQQAFIWWNLGLASAGAVILSWILTFFAIAYVRYMPSLGELAA